MIIEILEKYFHENPWSDMTKLEELIKLTGLDDITIKVNLKYNNSVICYILNDFS